MGDIKGDTRSLDYGSYSVETRIDASQYCGLGSLYFYRMGYLG